MNRNDLKALRPKIPTIIDLEATTASEQFQNRTLRPILKLQNDLLLNVFTHYIRQRKGVYYTLTEEKRLEYIEHAIRKDLKFKHLLIGLIVGQFTVEEWEMYIQQEDELRRRMTSLLVQRLQSQQIELRNR